MAVAVPFGQYVPGNTPVHRLDARVKLLLVALVVFALFACRGWLGLLACTLLVIAGFSCARITPRLALRGLKPVWLILLFTLLANALTFSAVQPAQMVALPVDQWLLQPSVLLPPAGVSEVDAPAQGLLVPQSIALIGSFGIRPLGALTGLYFALRITLLVCVTSLLIYTSSVVSLADAVVSLLSPLRRLKLPTEDIAMMFSIALRFIPLTASEAEKLVVAQTARGARFDQGGPVRRVKAYLPVLVPLFVNLFRRADSLAQAMESRCYQGQGRTRLVSSRLGRADILAAVVLSALLVAIGVLL
jgi:energy-coupling factor transport system permease protein